MKNDQLKCRILRQFSSSHLLDCRTVRHWYPLHNLSLSFTILVPSLWALCLCGFPQFFTLLLSKKTERGRIPTSKLGSHIRLKYVMFVQGSYHFFPCRSFLTAYPTLSYDSSSIVCGWHLLQSLQPSYRSTTCVSQCSPYP